MTAHGEDYFDHIEALWRQGVNQNGTPRLCHMTGGTCRCTTPQLCTKRREPETYVAGTGKDMIGSGFDYVAWVDGRDFNGFLLSGFGRTPLAAIVDLLDAEENAARGV